MRRRGFTLVELLVVIAIMAIVATIGISVGAMARRRSQEEATRALLGQVRIAIESYRATWREPPPDLPALLASRTRSIVAGDPGDPRSTRTERVGPFLQLKEDQISSDGKEILDAFGDPLLYDPARQGGLVWSRNVNDR